MSIRRLCHAAIVGVACISGATACAGSSESSGAADSVVDIGDTVAAVPASASSMDDLEAFCTRFGEQDVEQPELYVGSAEHVADIESLLAVAPDEVSGDLATYRDYLASGAIDSAGDPDSNMTENFPDDVQAAITDAFDFAATTC